VAAPAAPVAGAGGVLVAAPVAAPVADAGGVLGSRFRFGSAGTKV